jgi:hypothetical protein
LDSIYFHFSCQKLDNSNGNTKSNTLDHNKLTKSSKKQINTTRCELQVLGPKLGQPKKKKAEFTISEFSLQ